MKLIPVVAKAIEDKCHPACYFLDDWDNKCALFDVDLFKEKHGEELHYRCVECEDMENQV